MSAEDAAAALRSVAETRPDLVLLDLRLPDRDGLSLLEDIAARADAPPVVMMSGHGTLDAAVRATRLGALDFLEKPLQEERLLLTVRNALRMDALDRDVGALRRGLLLWHGMVGR